MRCSRKEKKMHGIFCGNFSSSRGEWPPCCSTWHAECYTSRGETPVFPTMEIKDEMGNPWHREAERQQRLMQGVDGAHLCIPFQCGKCLLKNLGGRDPIPGNDGIYMACIQRANLDAMAGKSPLTIGAHLREMIANARMINKTPSYQPRGPFPLHDSVGMGLAVDMLLKSLISKGRIQKHVQFLTLQRLQATQRTQRTGTRL
jgi:hypothetical protein